MLNGADFNGDGFKGSAVLYGEGYILGVERMLNACSEIAVEIASGDVLSVSFDESAEQPDTASIVFLSLTAIDQFQQPRNRSDGLRSPESLPEHVDIFGTQVVGALPWVPQVLRTLAPTEAEQKRIRPESRKKSYAKRKSQGM